MPCEQEKNDAGQAEYIGPGAAFGASAAESLWRHIAKSADDIMKKSACKPLGASDPKVRYFQDFVIAGATT